MIRSEFGFGKANAIADDALVENSDVSYKQGIAPGDTLVLPDITVTDSNGSQYTFPSVKDVVCTPSPVGATLMKSGQTISTSSYDDGATQRGRLTSFDTLSSNNPYGNTKRFLNKSGANTYTVKVTYDWDTYNGSTILAYYFGDMTTARSLTAQESQYVGSTFDGLTGWYLTNIVEMFNIMNFGLMANYQLNYPPFNTLQRYFWVSTQVAGTSGLATDLAGINPFTNSNKTSALYGIWVRVCTVTIAGGNVIIT